MKRFTVKKLGDGVGFYLNDNELIRQFQNQLKLFCGLRDKFNNFPGALPVALTRKNIHKLYCPSAITFDAGGEEKKENAMNEENNDGDHLVFQLPNGKGQRPVNYIPKKIHSVYYLTRKSDGIRYQLMFHYRDFGKCLDRHITLFDRSMNPIMVKFSVPDFAYSGTVLDGELVREETSSETQYVYYVFEMNHLNGYSVNKRYLPDRLMLIENFIPEIKSCPDTRESPFIFKTKKFFPVTELVRAVEYLKINSNTTGSGDTVERKK
jgi:hypothetical protein